MDSSQLLNQERGRNLAKYRVMSRVLSYHIQQNNIYLKLAEGGIILQFLTPDIVRLAAGKGGKVKLKTTPAVSSNRLAFEDFAVKELQDNLEVNTGSLKIIINKEQFALAFYDPAGQLISRDRPSAALGWKGKEVQAWKEMRPGERFYGLGEKTGFLDKRGRRYTMWNTDAFEAHTEMTDALYQSIPFLIGFNRGRAYGIYFDNSYKSYFDLRENQGDFRDSHSDLRDDYFSFSAEGGQLDYYFINGPDLKEVVNRYTALTGRMPLPPKWSLGYHQSRYSYHPEEEVRELARELRRRDIPCDAIHLDLHHMEGKRVFTWDEEEFPHPEEMLAELTGEGFKVVNIVDPGVKKDPAYHVYQQGLEGDVYCKYPGGKTYTGKVWPGECVFPDFTREEVREWWGDLYRGFIEDGVRGFWNDKNEPAVFNKRGTMPLNIRHENDGDPGSHRRFHNLYGFFENMAAYQGIKRNLKERPFLLSRAGFAGMQRYSAVWTGDNRSIWAHLEMAVPMLLNLGLSGFTFSGTDVGGFTGDSNGELLARWTELGALMPFFRNHCSIDAIHQEPWSFGKEYESIIRKYIKLRYSLLQHIYNLFYRASGEGIPVMRPLLMEYPDDRRTDNLADQFMLGESILAAPVCRPDCSKRLVYLPEGDWYNFWTGEIYEGARDIIAAAPLDKLPLYIKAGSIIPLTEPESYVGEGKADNLELNIFTTGTGSKGQPGNHKVERVGAEIEDSAKKTDSAGKTDSEKKDGDGTAEYLLYEDDGLSFAYREGEYNLTRFTWSSLGNERNSANTDINSGDKISKDKISKDKISTDKFSPDKVSADQGRGEQQRFALEIEQERQGYSSVFKTITLKIWGLEGPPSRVLINGRQTVPGRDWRYDKNLRYLLIHKCLPLLQGRVELVLT